MAFITNANYRRLKRTIVPSSVLSAEAYYKSKIFFLSRADEIQLVLIKNLLEGTLKIDEVKKIEVPRNPNLVYENTRPAYHYHVSCNRLSANYKNMKLPKVIKERGREEIIKFKTWMKSRRNAFADKSADLIKEMNVHFGVSLKLDDVIIPNSGSRNYINRTLEEIEEEIDETIKDAEIYLESEHRKKLLKYCIQSYNQTEIMHDRNDLDMFVNGLKEKFIDRIVSNLEHYYTIKFNKTELRLNVSPTILDIAGFNKCENCTNPNFDPENQLKFTDVKSYGTEEDFNQLLKLAKMNDKKR